MASELVVSKLPEIISKKNAGPKVTLKNSIVEVNNYIREYTQKRPPIREAGATVVACLIKKGTAYFGHMGDSRAYLLRDNNFQQITEDHSVVNQLIKHGMITEEEATEHPARHTITRCMGVNEEPVPDIRAVSYSGRRQNFTMHRWPDRNALRRKNKKNSY